MNTVSQIFPRTARISGPEVGDGAKPDVPTTDQENEKKEHLVFYEASTRIRVALNNTQTEAFKTQPATAVSSLIRMPQQTSSIQQVERVTFVSCD